MLKTAIVTDSNSGITQAEGKELGITVLPMPFYINEKMYYEDIDLTQEQFYQMLQDGASISTSQPVVANLLELWDHLLETYDEIVHIPMSSGLSGSCETAMALAREYHGRVEVVNNQRISVTQRQSVMDAITLAGHGYLKLPEEGRTHHARSRSTRHFTSLKAGSPDPGRETGRLRQSQKCEASEKTND